MTARVKTTAGPHMVGATFLATNFAPVLDLDQHFMRDTLQTGPTPGFTFFPHVGTVRIEGPFIRQRREGLAEPPTDFHLPANGAADEAACASRIVTNLATARIPAAGSRCRRQWPS